MQTFYGTQTVKAKPAFNINGRIYDKDKPVPRAMNRKDGYRVGFSDGSEEWTSKENFEKNLYPSSKMKFGHALFALEQGHKVTRAIWGGYWVIEETEKFGRIIVAYCKDGTIAPATPYQQDILAEDWMIVE